MVAMRKMEQQLLVESIVNRRDIPTVIKCLQHGAEMNEYILLNAHNDSEMLHAIVSNCPHVITINDGMIFTMLRHNYKRNKNKIRYLLENCSISVNAGLSSIILDAIRYKDIEMVKFISKKWDAALATPFVVAAKECQYDIVKFLFEHGTFTKNTLDIALCDAIFTNVDMLNKKEELKRIVAFLMKNGATKSAPLLKLCAYKSMLQQDFTVLITLMSFYDLHNIMQNLEEYSSNTMSIELYLRLVADAFRLQKAAKKIVHGFRVRRRLNLVRCIFRNKEVYSPSLAFIIARQSGL